MTELVFLESAYRHGVEEADTIWALTHPIRFFYKQGDLALTVATGFDRAALVVLEVGYTLAADYLTIHHSMPARSKYL